MTITQQIFLLFFGIFWGAISNVQSRWKMFQPLYKYTHIKNRLLLSIFLINVAPLIFFAWIFYCLGDVSDADEGKWSLWQTLAGVLPAFGIFAFYRLWMAVVEFTPTTFYQSKKKQSSKLKLVEPTLEELKLNHKFGGRYNLIFSSIYFMFAMLGPYVPRFVDNLQKLAEKLP